jgi:hypothetical protein
MSKSARISFGEKDCAASRLIEIKNKIVKNFSITSRFDTNESKPKLC